MTPEQKIFHNSFLFRGAIISDVGFLERLIDLYLSNYFCESEKKVTEFIDIILGGNRISLDGKRKILDIVLKRVDPGIYLKIPDFNRDMNMALMERNNFAHCTLSNTSEALTKCDTHIGLAKFGKTTRVEWYDQQKIDDIRNAIKKCSDTMKSLLGME
jgi:hypothetical protein